MIPDLSPSYTRDWDVLEYRQVGNEKSCSSPPAGRPGDFPGLYHTHPINCRCWPDIDCTTLSLHVLFCRSLYRYPGRSCAKPWALVPTIRFLLISEQRHCLSPSFSQLSISLFSQRWLSAVAPFLLMFYSPFHVLVWPFLSWCKGPTPTLAVSQHPFSLSHPKTIEIWFLDWQWFPELPGFFKLGNK